MAKTTITIEDGIATLENGQTVDLLKIQAAFNSAAQDSAELDLIEAINELSRVTQKWQGPHGIFLDGTYNDNLATELRTGSDADIWYDARHYGDTEKEQLIDRTKSAMYTAAELLEAGEDMQTVVAMAQSQNIRIEEIIDDLQAGLDADIWYDADQYGDTTAMARIEVTQGSMSLAISMLTLPSHEQRIQQYEQEGTSRSDAQGVVEAEALNKARASHGAPKF